MTQIAAYVDDHEVRRLDALRGDISRSKVMSRALRRYIVELENGKESLLPGPKVSPNQAQTAAVQQSSFASPQSSNSGGLSATKKGDAG